MKSVFVYNSLVMPNKKPRVHFIGIGGIGMSYLARYFKTKKWAVSGSDLEDSDLLQTLKKEGIQVKIGHKNGVIDGGTGLVVASQAVPAGNPEVLEAKRLGVPVVPFPKAVGDLTHSYDTIAVAGAHGKSTTTAMTALMLVKAGLDPTVMVGTKLKEFPQENFRAGKGKHLVLEADEYGRAFLNYSPAVAIVTAIDREHLDTYKNLADVKKTFLKFLSQTREKGELVLNADDKNIFSLKKRIAAIAKIRKLKVVWYSLKGADAKKVARVVKIPGQHNISNALAALNAARLVGVKDAAALSALSAFRGTWRRMEYRGAMRIANRESRMNSLRHIHGSSFTVQVYDDYAHHPTEIKASLAAFKQGKEHPFVICVFQPHQAKRLEFLFNDFVGSFGDADVLILIPMYKVAGRDPSTGSGQVRKKYDSHKLAKAIKKRYPKKPVYYLDNPKKLKKLFVSAMSTSQQALRNKHFVLVLMGAGNINLLTGELLK